MAVFVILLEAFIVYRIWMRIVGGLAIDLRVAHLAICHFTEGAGLRPEGALDPDGSHSTTTDDWYRS